MKRLVLGAAAALVLTLTCQQQAAASGFSFNGSVGVSVSVSANFQCWGCCQPSCWSACPSCYGGGYGYSAPAYYAAPSYYPSYPTYAGSYAPAANYGTVQQAPAAPLPQGPAIANQGGVQTMGYSYYGNYGYNQVPSYWYGR